MSDEVPTGWVSPRAKPLPETLEARIAELRAEWAEARNQLRRRDQGIRPETLVKVRNLTRARSNWRLPTSGSKHCRGGGRPRKAPS